ncbi:AAA family ATPase [Paraburkholderia phenazinium]|uniref:AAA ATPase domain-containing protein n=1 Tax=Paraburkholderia phenazinium TaxID=60549 RepID=A0A1G8DU20_9BURK|nr:AAA family ATPase [Paraburkholderia phenazinium]SDH61091.1 AAA ATPase domain-containing protein [Paraburkholderia phenazinium]
MKFDKVRLTNYRCHRDLEACFTPNFNVLIGVNGSGKTSLLRAIAETFSGFIHFAALGTTLIPHSRPTRFALNGSKQEAA